MDQMDERQRAVRGKISMRALIGMIIYLMLAAFVNDAGMIDIEHEIGFSDFLIFTIMLLISFVSVSMILQDAYIGVMKDAQMKFCLWVFTILAILEDVLCILDLIQGDSMNIVHIGSLLMVNGVSLCLWIKHKEWSHD